MFKGAPNSLFKKLVGKSWDGWHSVTRCHTVFTRCRRRLFTFCDLDPRRASMCRQCSCLPLPRNGSSPFLPNQIFASPSLSYTIAFGVAVTVGCNRASLVRLLHGADVVFDFLVLPNGSGLSCKQNGPRNWPTLQSKNRITRVKWCVDPKVGCHCGSVASSAMHTKVGQQS